MDSPLQQTFLGATELDDELIKQLPKEVLLRVFSYLDVVSLCRCAQVTELVASTPREDFDFDFGTRLLMNFLSCCRYANIGTCWPSMVPAGRKSICSTFNVISRWVSERLNGKPHPYN